MEMTRIAKCLSHLKQNAAGNAVVETALYLPIALVLFGGMVDFSLAVSQKLQAQQAIARTLEMTNNVGFSGLDLEMLSSEAAKAANVARERVEAKIWLECDGVEQTSISGQCNTSDGLARYASIAIEDDYQLNFYSTFANVVQKETRPGFRVQGSLRIQ
jgi:hypothetical protein